MFKKLLFSFAILFAMVFSYDAKAIQVTIGANNGSNCSTCYPCPLQDWYCTQYAQYLYTATELQNAGLTPNSIITDAGWDVLINPSTTSYYIEDYTLYMKNTTTTTLNAWEDNMTIVHSPADITGLPPLGINMFALNATPFIWDGVSNLVVQVCGGKTFQNGGSFTTHPSCAYTTGLAFNGTYMFRADGSMECNNLSIAPSSFAYTPTTRPVIILDYIPGTPCVGQPVAGTPTSASTTICPGLNAFITSTGITLAANMTYQWLQSTNGGVTWSNVASSGNGPSYTTPSLLTTTMYKIGVTCNNSTLTDTSAPITITVTGPTYATLPYEQDFETWTNFCATMDVPQDASGIHFSNFPSSTNDSWRREDQGATANWNTPIGGIYTPVSSKNNHSARFHTYNTSNNGSLDMYVDCSSSTAAKMLSFDYINDNITWFGFDFMEVAYSDNGGVSFTSLGLVNSSASWQNFPFLINSSSPTTIIRFKAYGDNMNTDIGIDNVLIVDSCTGTPNAGAIANIVPCPNTLFNVTLTGNTQAAGLDYQWESAPTAAGPWTTLGNTAVPSYGTQISAPTYFRCIVTCLASGLSSTTAPQLINIGSFFVCYCQSYSTTPFTHNISNFKMYKGASQLISNGTALPLLNNATSTNHYSNFTNITPINIYRDSTYVDTLTTVTYTNFYTNGYAKVYIDYNADGVFDPISEEVCGGLCNSPSQLMVANFTVPSNATFGITGMRIVYQEGGTATTVTPCGVYLNGETEDYLVNIIPPPCINPPFAGTAIISDTAICPGYSVFLQDTTHHLLYSGLNFNWQISSNGVNFADISGATADTLTYVVNNNTWFRFKTVCTNANGTFTTYSNIVHVTMNLPIQCYPISIAVGGSNDTTDIGAMNIVDKQTNNNIFSFVTGGPHLANPLAVKGRTDYTNLPPMVLYADSTYGIAVYDIMRTFNHADARVTAFIDYNNNNVYDVPSERIFAGVSTVNTFYLTGEFHTPVLPALNISTGMRVIINNDLGSSSASDNGVGTYISGETEDYVVKFKLKNNAPNAIDETLFDINNVSVYPNPTSGKINVNFIAKNTTDVTIQLMTITGSEILSTSFEKVIGKQSKTIDLTGFAKGTYMLKINSSNGNYVRKVTVE